MVHKKSEYRLNYKWIPSDICRRTWETGATYRFQRRRYDLSHLPLPWEGAPCDCDVEDDDIESILPVPKTRLKHNVLTESKDKDNLNNIPSQRPLDDEEWYRRWEEMEHRYTPVPTPPPLKFKHPHTENFPPRQSVRFTPPREKEVMKAAVSIPVTEDVHSTPYIPYCTEELKINRDNNLSDAVKEKMVANSRQQEEIGPGFQKTYLPVHHRGTQTPPRCWAAPRSPRIVRTDICETAPSTAPVDRPKMIPYGWASRRDIGDKKTYNIYAPTGNPEQFYSSALRAWKRKEIDMHRKVDEVSQQTQRYLDSTKYERHRPTNPSSIWMIERDRQRPINPSSIWTTEYQRQYREEPKHPRPMSAPPSRAHRLGTIYHQCCL